jgi:3-oxoacid CoA-transferase subunit A
MIYITGDTHGNFKRIKEFCQKMNTNTDDTLIILGDAGINYHLNDFDDDLKRELSKFPITLLCIHGNHEARPHTIKSYKETEWKGGTIYTEPEYPNILFAKDGEIYDFDGKKAIVIGGAYSVDKEVRLIRGLKWFKDEQPGRWVKRRVEKQLNDNNWAIDIVLSHTAPLKYEPTEVFIPWLDQSKVDKSTEFWLDSIENRLDYEKWYAGHYHTEKKIDKLEFMFNNFTHI